MLLQEGVSIMLDRFNLQMETGEKIASALKSVWNTEYSELYDDLYYGKNNLSDAGLEKDIQEILYKHREGGQELNYKKDFYVGLSLCCAVFPSLEVVLSKNQLESFRVFMGLVKPGVEIDVGKLPNLPSINDVPGIVVEAVSVFHDMLNIIKKRNVEEAVLNMIDSCLIGAAICHGSSDKRAILNWFLIYVIPFSENCKIPDFIYTIKTKLPENWKYSKIEI